MKLAIRESRIQGRGVFATGPIFRGEVILLMDDSRVVDEAHPLRPEFGEDAKHCDWLPDGTQVLMREPECYINHCCEPNVRLLSQPPPLPAGDARHRGPRGADLRLLDQRR